MTDTRLLIRHYLKGQGGAAALFGVKSIRTVWGKIGIAFLSLYMALVFGFMIYASALSRAMLSGNRFIVTVFFYTVSFPFIFLSPFAIGLFQGGKDLDMLLSLPVKRESLFRSRFTVLMIYMVPFSLIVFVPTIVLSVQLFKGAWQWYAAYVLMHFSALTCCALVLAAVSTLFPKQIVQIMNTVVAFIMMMGLLRESTASMDPIFEGGVLQLRVPTPSVTLPLILLLMTAALSAVLWPVTGRRFGKKVRDLDIGRKHRKAVQRSGTPVRALIKSEYMQIRSDSSLMSEFIMEFILPIFLIVLYMIMGIAGDLLEIMNTIPEAVRVLLPAFLVGGTATINMMCSTTFSREGKMREIYASLPITRRERLASKALIHILSEIPTVVICIGVFSRIFRVGAVTGILSGIWCMEVSVLTAVIGLDIDIRNPYRKWEKRVEALKKNFNGMKAFALSFLLGALSIAPWCFLHLDARLVLVIAMAVTALFILLSASILRKAEERI